MNKTAKEWIASVKDPVIKRYLEENVLKELIDIVKDNFESFVLGTFDWEGTPQHLYFWFEVSKSDPSTLSYSDFKHLDKSVETPKTKFNLEEMSKKVDEILKSTTPESIAAWLEMDRERTVKSVVETQLKEDKQTPKMDKLQHPTAFRKEWMKNNAHVVNTEHHELLLMKAYALYYHDYKTRSVEQPKVSVNEDAVEFKEWTYKTRKVIFSDNKGILIWHDEGTNKRFTTTELYQNYLEDKHK